MSDHLNSSSDTTPNGHPGAAMDATLKAKWIEALRSGKYQQGTGKLHDPKEDTYCCLGVLCSVMGAAWSAHYYEYEDEDEGTVVRNLDHVPLLDGRLLSSDDDEELASGFEKELGIDQSVLVGLNDGRHLKEPENPNRVREHSFEEIANWIENNVPSSATSDDRSVSAEQSEVR